MSTTRELSPSGTRASAVLMAATAALLGTAIVLASFAYGATEVWSACCVQVLAAAAAVLWLVCPQADTRLLAIPAAAVLLGVLQLVPLPGWALEAVSPFSYDARAAVHGGTGGAGCVSVHPAATLAAVRQLFLMTLTVFVAWHVGNVRWRRFAMAGLIAAVGAGVLVLGVFYPRSTARPALGIHDLTGPIHAWKNPLLPPMHSSGCGFSDTVHVGPVRYAVDWCYSGDPVGPFLVSNHFAGFMNLTLPVAMGLVLAWGAARKMRLAAAVLAVVLAGAVPLITACCSQSRAGVSGLLVGVLALACLYASSKARWLWGGVLGVVVVGMGLLFVRSAGWIPDGLLDGPSLPRVAAVPLRRLALAAHGRVDAWRICGRMWGQSPLLGTGLGTFADVQKHFRAGVENLYFAHNEYAQFAGEAGLVGVALAGAAVVALARRAVRGWRELSHPADRALAAGLVGAIAGFAVHCIFEWNMHVPASSLVVAVVIGLLLALAGPAEPERDETPAKERARFLRWRFRRPRGWGRMALAALAVAAAVAAARDWTAARLLDPLRRAVVAQRVLDVKASRSDKTEVLRGAPLSATAARSVYDALPAAQRAAALDPWNAQTAAWIGLAYLHLSEGCKPELMLADEWLGRSAKWCPADEEVVATRAEVRYALQVGRGRGDGGAD